METDNKIATEQADTQNDNNNCDTTDIANNENSCKDTPESLNRPIRFFLKLTEKQQKTVQILFGLLSGLLIWISLTYGLNNQDNAFSRWLFIFIFAIIMIGKNHIERTTGISLRTFTKSFLAGLIIFMAVFIIYGAVNGLFNEPPIKS